MSYKKTIGILGGSGPAASADIYSKIIKLSQKIHGATEDTDFPKFIMYNFPIAGFNELGFKSPNLVKKQLVDGVKGLEKFGSDAIIIACNTLHYFYNEASRAVKIPIINIISETVKLVLKNKLKTVGVLNSRDGKKFKIYENELKKYKIKCLQVTNEEQKIINKTILKVMSGAYTETDKKDIRRVIKRLSAGGAEGVIVGCTELSMVISQSDTPIKLFDSADVIAQLALFYAFKK